MRFLADENVSHLVIKRLRADGFEVISISETRPGVPDKDVLGAADAEGCILITEDRDFGELVSASALVFAAWSSWNSTACPALRKPTSWLPLFPRTLTSCRAISL